MYYGKVVQHRSLYSAGMRPPKIRAQYSCNRHYSAHYHSGESHLCLRVVPSDFTGTSYV